MFGRLVLTLVYARGWENGRAVEAEKVNVWLDEGKYYLVYPSTHTATWDLGTSIAGPFELLDEARDAADYVKTDYLKIGEVDWAEATA